MAVGLHQQVHNPGGARSAVLVHGLGSDGATMWRFASHLAVQGYRVVCPDLRGHGLSPPSSSYTVGDIADDVALLGEGWDLVVGHSLGGAVVASLLTRRGWARRALLLDPVLRLTAAGKDAVLPSQLAEVEGALTIEALQEQQPGWDDEDVFRKVRASAMVSRHVVRRCIVDTDPWDVLADAERWDAEVTILAADPSVDALFTPDHAGAVRDLPRVQVLVAAGCGHSVHRDNPTWVLEQLDRVIR